MQTDTQLSLSPADKANVLVEALPYIQRFQGSCFVIKLGGAFMESREAQQRVATDMVYLSAVGIRVVAVHGGGKAISRAMEAAGLQPVFSNGLRVTDAEAVDIVGHTLDKEINLDLCELAQQRGGRPLGMAGRSVFQCQRLKENDKGEPIDIGFVGRIHKVDTVAIENALEKGYMPIISPTAMDAAGQLYNTNADTAAACVASALRARRLVYLCDVPGLLQNPPDVSSLISTLYIDEVQGLKDTGVISSGMAPKVDSAIQALSNGVRRVHFIDGRQPHSMLLEIFTDKGIGTEIVNR